MQANCKMNMVSDPTYSHEFALFIQRYSSQVRMQLEPKFIAINERSTILGAEHKVNQ